MEQVDLFVGRYAIEFINKRIIITDLDGCLQDVNGQPIVLLGADGKQYNWQNILSTKKE